MRRIVSRTILVTTLFASLVTAPAATAGYDPTAPNGALCGVTQVASPEPGAQPDERVAEIDAGPATTQVPGTLVCTVQVDASTHSGGDTVVREFPAAPGGAIAGVETVAFSWPAGADAYVCSAFRKADGSTSYFTRGAGWHTDPDMPCSVVFEPRFPPALEPPVGPTGLFCGYTAQSDPRPGAGSGDMIGEVDAGPAVTDVPGTLVCTIQLYADTHEGPDAAVREFPDVQGVIAGVQTVTYTRPADAPGYLCTSFRKADNSGTIYWTGGDGGGWHTDPSRPCAVQTPGTQAFWNRIDRAVCPLLRATRSTPGPAVTVEAIFVDEEGDVFVDTDGDGFSEADAMNELFWDCPVYTFTLDDNSNPDDVDPTNPGVIDW